MNQHRKRDRDAWLGSNPLRVWMLANDYNSVTLAAALGISMPTIYTWRTGLGLPRVYAGVLDRFTGCPMTRRLTVWLAGRPAGGGGAADPRPTQGQ